MKLSSLLLALALIIPAAAPRAANLAPGLGTASPQTEQVYSSDEVAVYKWETRIGKIFQINDAAGQVVTAFVLAKDGVETLGIGSLDPQHVTAARNAPRHLTPMDESAACPCSAQVVYQDATTTIVVVTGANGQVIEVVTIRYETDPK